MDADNIHLCAITVDGKLFLARFVLTLLTDHHQFSPGLYSTYGMVVLKREVATRADPGRSILPEGLLDQRKRWEPGLVSFPPWGHCT